jgi:murein endopeptidase
MSIPRWLMISSLCGLSVLGGWPFAMAQPEPAADLDAERRAAQMQQLLSRIPERMRSDFLPEAPETKHLPLYASLDTPPETAPEARCGYMTCLPLVPLQDDVYYTVTEKNNTVAQQAARWGVPSNVIIALNDNLTLESVLKPGQKLLVEARMASAPVPYSSGKANRGRLRDGRLMPEGKGYYLRDLRPHSWGTDTTIQSLMTAFDAYAKAYPDGPPINVGDISRRRGGRFGPHKSHQSGRDVDIGFVHFLPPNEPIPQHFTRASESNLDVEKTWVFLEALIRTGNVQMVFVDVSVQKLLRAHARDKLTPEQLDAIFSWPHSKSSSSALLRHWPGHKNHFHVRFKCPPNQLGCRS